VVMAMILFVILNVVRVPMVQNFYVPRPYLKQQQKIVLALLFLLVCMVRYDIVSKHLVLSMVNVKFMPAKVEIVILKVLQVVAFLPVQENKWLALVLNFSLQHSVIL